jgi:hypothetical protein
MIHSGLAVSGKADEYFYVDLSKCHRCRRFGGNRLGIVIFAP